MERRTDKSPRRSLGRSRTVLLVVGGVMMLAGIVAAVAPVREGLEFRRTVTCDRGVGDCFGRDPATVVRRWSYTTTSTDSNGHTSTEVHYRVTWQRPDGRHDERTVSSRFYLAVREGQPVDLRTWRGEVVGVEAAGGAHWFQPNAGKALQFCLYLVWFGLGASLWAFFFGWWDGWFMLAFRTVLWLFIGGYPAQVAADSVTYGFDPGEIGWLIYLPSFGAFGLAVTLHRGWRGFA